MNVRVHMRECACAYAAHIGVCLMFTCESHTHDYVDIGHEIFALCAPFTFLMYSLLLVAVCVFTHMRVLSLTHTQATKTRRRIRWILASHGYASYVPILLPVLVLLVLLLLFII